MADIQFRPHHFLCALGFRGKGYSDEFTSNMSRIVVDRLRGDHGSHTTIEVVGEADSICAPCPKRVGTSCVSADKIWRLDTRHTDALSVETGDVLTWGEALERMAALPDDTHSTACDGCEWLALGVCKDALIELKRQYTAKTPK